MYFFFFFKQKTAYEMRISDWSSDVCSSDLIGSKRLARGPEETPHSEADPLREGGMVHPARSACCTFRSDVWNVYIEENSKRKSLSSIDKQKHKRMRLDKNSSSCRQDRKSVV